MMGHAEGTERGCSVVTRFGGELEVIWFSELPLSRNDRSLWSRPHVPMSEWAAGCFVIIHCSSCPLTSGLSRKMIKSASMQ